MPRPFALFAPLAVAAVLAGCGDGVSPASEAVDRQVRAAFTAYTAAIGRRDYREACRYLAPESITRLRRGAERIVANPPTACPAVLGVVLGRATPKAKRELVEIARTARVKQVVLGQRGPMIRWSAEVDGKRVPVTQEVRRIHGAYKLVSITR